MSVHLPSQGEPQPLQQPGLARINSQAQRLLRQRGLLTGVWSDRLANASPRLIRFINRFHRASGFERVIRDYFAGLYKRAGAILAMRLAHRLADRSPDFSRRLSFERVLGFAPGGHPVHALEIVRNGMHYKLKPWSRLYPFALRGQFLRDVALFGRPDQIRWVFDGQRLGRQKGDVVREVRRILASGRFSQTGHPDHRRWLDALDKIIVVI